MYCSWVFFYQGCLRPFRETPTAFLTDFSLWSVQVSETAVHCVWSLWFYLLIASLRFGLVPEHQFNSTEDFVCAFNTGSFSLLLVFLFWELSCDMSAQLCSFETLQDGALCPSAFCTNYLLCRKWRKDGVISYGTPTRKRLRLLKGRHRILKSYQNKQGKAFYCNFKWISF